MQGVIADHIQAYLNGYNKIPQNLALLMEQASRRTDIVPAVQQETGCLLHLLVKISGARTILELGTCIGISGIFLSSALPNNGRLTTIDHSERFAAEAATNFKVCDVYDKVEQVVGDVCEVVPSLTETYDLIFQDSGKQTYTPLLDVLVERLNPGGMLILDDTLFPVMDLPERNHNSQRALGTANQRVKDHPLLESVLLPVGDGLTIARKRC